MQINELALFAGGGGGLLASDLLGFRTAVAVEIVSEAREVLLRRQADGCLPKFPIWDDVRTFDGAPWRGHIDVITGGFPCTDISSVGSGQGITGESSSLFFEMLRIVEEVRPRFVFAENSPRLRTKGLGAILSGLARLGYDAKWGVLGARDLGANHERKRMWVVATNAHNQRKRSGSFNAKEDEAPSDDKVVVESTNADIERGEPGNKPEGTSSTVADVEGPINRGNPVRDIADADREIVREQPRRGRGKNRENSAVSGIINWWNIPRFARMDDGCSDRMDVEKALAKLEVGGMEEKPSDRNARVVMTGNMQVPIVAVTAWRILNVID